MNMRKLRGWKHKGKETLFLSLLIPILVHGTFDSLLFLSSKVSLLMVTILIVYLYISSYFKIKQTSLKTKKITGE